MNMVSTTSNMSTTSTPTINGAESAPAPSHAIDAYALFEALTGRKIDRPKPHEADGEDYDNLSDIGQDPSPDTRPHNINVGCINPYALAENLIGRRMDRRSINSARILSDVLQTDYDELFDLRHNSVLFAGLELNTKDRTAEKLQEKDVRIVQERDLVTPDLSRVQHLDDLKHIGLKDVGNLQVKMARMQNGKLRLIVNAHQIAHTVNNRAVTLSINELALPFRRNGGHWQPPNGSWRDMYDTFSLNSQKRLIEDVMNFRIGRPKSCNPEGKFDDPVQGCSPNSWLIAAIHSCFWADPNMINRDTRVFTGTHNGTRGGLIEQERERTLSIKLHDKGGPLNNKTMNVDVTYEIPVNNSSLDPIYCQASDHAEIWPSLYEKAFAKWITDSSGQHPDITQTAHGDPIKAMAQINGRDPHYFLCDKHSADTLAGLVRLNCVNYRSINPMSAFTYATAPDRLGSRSIYRGANLVANHAYSVLGWASQADRQYIILRNPWGVTEPKGLTSYPGLIDRVEPEFWRPACLCDSEGVLALEANAFKEYFSCIGVAK